jgi:glycosyltransferase involved in cell wall biosynthesis
MSREPLRVSAIIPLYNGAPFIERALRGALTQTLNPAEIIVVDHGSRDGGTAIVERLSHAYPIRLLRKQNGGQSSARNLGIAHSGGDLVAFLDQDDVWYPNHLEELTKPFLNLRHEQTGWVYSDVDEIDKNGFMVRRRFLSHIPTRHPKQDLYDCLASDMLLLPSASVISKKALEDVGGFDEHLSGYAHEDLFLRIFRAGFKAVYLNEAFSEWRNPPPGFPYHPPKDLSIYARKLLSLYEDDPAMGRYFARDILGPRFLVPMLFEYKRTIHDGEPDLIRASADDLRFIRKFVRPKHRARISLVLGLGSLGKIAFALQPFIRPLYRRLLS